jgi:hypothetical protein
MLKHHSRKQLQHRGGSHLLLVLVLPFIFLSLNGCNFFQPSGKQTIKTSDGKKIDLNDATVKQYVAEWHDSKASIERLSGMENDLAFLLSEVSKMSDLGQTPGMGKTMVTTAAFAPALAPAPAAGVTSATSIAPLNNNTNTNNTNPAQVTQAAVSVPNTTSSNPEGNSTFINVNNAFCPEVFINSYKKTIAFSSFPRMHMASSKIGALHQVEQHLPMLIGANLRNRHQMLTPTHIRETFVGANQRGELLTATQAQTLARQHRVQFLVSGEVDDMSMSFPNSLEKPNYYTRFISGAHNFLNINTPLDKRSRVFSFTLEARDGFTGQLIFSNQYQTFGKWKATPEAEIGFGSPRFWQTDYGIQIQQLVAKASDELAGALHCQPYMARVDSSPYQQQIVIQSGANNGMRSGDALDLYQLVYQPIPGEYQKFDTRLVRRNGRVYLTEIYPSHSVGQVVNETLTAGQYLVKAQ